MKRGAPLKRYTRLGPMSKKRESDRARRKVIVLAALARDRRSCRAASLVPEVACRGPLDAHEVIPRSAWAGGYLVLDNVLSVCRAHHDWIDDNVEAAHSVGLHAYSWERSAGSQ